MTILICSAKRLKDRRKPEKFKEIDEKEEYEDKDRQEGKDKPVNIMDEAQQQANKVDSNKLLSPELAKGSELVNGGNRSGASSPSPSDGMPL